MIARRKLSCGKQITIAVRLAHSRRIETKPSRDAGRVAASILALAPAHGPEHSACGRSPVPEGRLRAPVDNANAGSNIKGNTGREWRDQKDVHLQGRTPLSCEPRLRPGVT
jgi:hypothetical protein